MLTKRSIRCGFRLFSTSAVIKGSRMRTLQSLPGERLIVNNSRRSYSSANEQPSGEGPGRPYRGSEDRPIMSWRTFAWFCVGGSAVAFAVHLWKKKIDDEIAANIAKNTGSIGKALLGGPWELVNHDNKLVTWRDYLGKWLIIYFGFTHCPDICPEELEKLCKVLESLKKDPRMPKVYPLFFTVDPYRDRPDNIKKYCEEYSPELVGFSGSVEQVGKVCRMFRVYFSEGPKMEDDYIVDHSIIMYLMNPEGEYVEHYTRDTPEKHMEIKVRRQILAYQEADK